jgi:hypothetical protein
MSEGRAMRKKKASAILICMAVVTAFLSCSRTADRAVELANLPLNSMEGIITRDSVSLDSKISSDGQGSLRVETTKPLVVKLFEISGLNAEQARLLYRARLRTQNLQGQAYLEMWVRFPAKGEFFSRGLNNVLTGTTEWTSVETPFILQKNERPDLVRLNLVINGSGTVWIDDVRLIKGIL